MPWINGAVDKQNTGAGEFLCTVEFIGEADPLLEQLIREFRSEDISTLLNEESKHGTEDNRWTVRSRSIVLRGGKVVSERLLSIARRLEESELHARLIRPLTATFRRRSRPRRILQLVNRAHVSGIETWLRVRVQEYFVDVDHTLQNIWLATIEHGAAHNINCHVRGACSLERHTSSCRREGRELRTYFEGSIVFVVLNDTFEIAGDGLKEIVHVVLCLDRIAQATIGERRGRHRTMHFSLTERLSSACFGPTRIRSCSAWSSWQQRSLRCIAHRTLPMNYVPRPSILNGDKQTGVGSL